MNLKLILFLASLAAAFAGLGWHQHVVHQRDHWHTAATKLEAQLTSANQALSESERLRGLEANAAKGDLVVARTDTDARVKEARRSAGAIKRIVEKPRAAAVQTGCPAPDLVTTHELRDALQPDPVGAAPAAEPSDVSAAAAGAAPARWGDPGAADAGPSWDREDVELDVGRAGVGQGPLSTAGPAGGVEGL